MPFLLLLVLALVCLQREWPEPPEWAGAAGSVLLTWVAVVAFVGSAGLLSRRLRVRLGGEDVPRPSLLRRYSAWRRYHFFGLLAAYLTLLCLLGWGWTARRALTTPAGPLPGVELLILSPLLAGLVLSWARFYDMERAVHETALLRDEAPFPGRWTYVGLQARHNLLLIVPPLLLILIQQAILGLFPGLQENELVVPVLGATLLILVFVGIPWVLRLMLGLKPLPDGPLRDRLLAAARRLKFRCNDILLWDTRNTVANAMVTGPSPFLRYVVLTDRLVNELEPEEVEAVFGHEVGHVKHHHMLFYFLFLLVSLVALVGVWKVLEEVEMPGVHALLNEHVPGVMAWLSTYQILAMLPLLTVFGVYIFVVFGFLSRRCERQADIHGCRTVSVQVFIDALEKVARLNGISRDRPGWLSSWQHSTIARRVDFLEQMRVDPALEPRFQRSVWRLKLGMALCLGAALWALGGDRLWGVLKQF
jgi:Zn-dependent protease with chaperone function